MESYLNNVFFLSCILECETFWNTLLSGLLHFLSYLTFLAPLLSRLPVSELPHFLDYLTFWTTSLSGLHCFMCYYIFWTTSLSGLPYTLDYLIYSATSFPGLSHFLGYLTFWASTYFIQCQEPAHALRINILVFTCLSWDMIYGAISNILRWFYINYQQSEEKCLLFWLMMTI